jgi:hypothetical protein
MKLLRLLALAIAATAWCAVVAFACPGSKTSATSASSCGTSKSTTATAAAHAGCASKATATTAAASPKSAGTCAASAACPMSSEQCKAMTASGACTAQMQAACAAKGTKSASAGTCDMHGAAAHAECSVCSDEMACDTDVKASGARAQVVPLRNGTMIVYTLDSAEGVRGLQAAVARYNEQVVSALQGDAKLCAACKKLRGALASGKLVREVVNVERGCQLLITSTDRSIVQQVHACTNAQVAARTKS